MAHTDSSMVPVGARRSSPGICDVRYDCVDDAPRPPLLPWMLPVRGARSDVPCAAMGSSRSSSVAGRRVSVVCSAQKQ
ncbi:MAG: hypothetical protein INR71_08980 [Terriglobus roseus]|nr:hypothetical protein [Terriglobus roseus]